MKKTLLISVVILLLVGLILSGCTSTTTTTTAPPPSSTTAAPPPSSSTAAPPPSSTTAKPPPPSSTAAPPPPSSTAPPAGAKTLTIGNINSLTGMFSDFEKFDPQGAQLAVDYVNSKGGITINGQKYNVELYVLDGKANPEGVIAAANAMIYDKGIKFICGEAVTPLAIALDSVTEQGGAIFSARFTNSSPNELGTKFPLKFIGGNCYFSGMRASLSYLHKKYSLVKTFAFEAIDDGTLKTATPVINKFASQYGLKMTGDVVGFDFSVQDMTPIVQKVLAMNPDAIMTGAMTLTSTGLSIKGFRDLGFKGPIFGVIFGAADQMMSIVGKDRIEGMFLPGFPGELTKIGNFPQVTQDLVRMGIAKYGNFNMTHLQGCNGAFSMLMAIQAAQSLDPKVVAAKWETMTNIDTPLGPGKMGGKETYGVNHVTYSATPMQQVINGSIQLVDMISVDDSLMP